jgi:hypothetical protein
MAPFRQSSRPRACRGAMGTKAYGAMGANPMVQWGQSFSSPPSPPSIAYSAKEQEQENEVYFRPPSGAGFSRSNWEIAMTSYRNCLREYSALMASSENHSSRPASRPERRFPLPVAHWRIRRVPGWGRKSRKGAPAGPADGLRLNTREVSNAPSGVRSEHRAPFASWQQTGGYMRRS